MLNELMSLVGGVLIILGVVLFFIYHTSRAGAPWFPSSQTMVHKMLALADVRPGEVVYDLGSGDGRVLIAAARDFQARAVGIEIEPLRCAWTRWQIRRQGLQQQITLIQGDFFAQDLSQADVVIVYLLQKTNMRLMAKLQRELRPGTRLLSRRFIFPGWPLAARDEASHLYLYRMEGLIRNA